MPLSVGRSIISTAGILAAAGLLLTGCSVGAVPEGAGSSPGVTPTGSPLDKYRAALDSIYEEDPNIDYAAIALQYEQAVAECMTAEGFLYTPVPPASADDYSDGGFFEGYGTLKWAEVYGYGISTNEAGAGNQSDYVDPNVDYVASLSDSERDAYYEALYGPQPTEEQLAAMEDSETSVGWETTGCTAEAGAKYYPEVEEPTADAEFADLIEKMDSVTHGLESEPAVLAAVEEWSGCMASAGYPGLVETYDASQFMNTEYAKLYGYTEGDDGELKEPEAEPSAQTSSFGTGLGAGTSAVAVASMLPSAIDVDGYGIKPSDEALAEFRTKEIAMAVADVTCLEESSVERITNELQVERETVFVNENKEALDRMLEKLSK